MTKQKVMLPLTCEQHQHDGYGSSKDYPCPWCEVLQLKHERDALVEEVIALRTAGEPPCEHEPFLDSICRKCGLVLGSPKTAPASELEAAKCEHGNGPTCSLCIPPQRTAEPTACQHDFVNWSLDPVGYRCEKCGVHSDDGVTTRTAEPTCAHEKQHTAENSSVAVTSCLDCGKQLSVEHKTFPDDDLTAERTT